MKNTQLEREIARLTKHIVGFSIDVEQTLGDSFKAFLKGDAEAARTIIERDKEIDREEVNLEQECLRIITLNQPVAADLRRLIAYIKINGDLERMGDLAKTVAKNILHLLPHQPLPYFPEEQFAPMIRITQGMARRSLSALATGQARDCVGIFEEDDKVDDLNRQIILSTQNEAERHPGFVRPALALISVSRAIEHTADVATNIAEDVYYMVYAEIIRHHHKKLE